MRPKRMWAKVLSGLLIAAMLLQDAGGISLVQAENNVAEQEVENKTSAESETESKREDEIETEISNDSKGENGTKQEDETKPTEVTTEDNEEETPDETIIDSSNDSEEELSKEETETETETLTTEIETNVSNRAKKIILTAENRQMSEVTFEPVISFSGFYVHIYKDTTITIVEPDNYQDVSIYLVQYDEEKMVAKSDISMNYFSVDNGVYTLSNISFQDLITGEISQDTTSVALMVEAYDLNGEIQTFVSDKIIRTNKFNNVLFTVSDFSAGIDRAEATIYYTGDMEFGNDRYYADFNVVLYYGTDSNSKNWQSIKTSFEAYYDTETWEEKHDMYFNGIESNKTYHGKIIVYMETDSYIDEQYKYAFYQEIDIDDFATKEDKTIDFQKAFPDDMFRNVVVKTINDSSVSADDETIAISKLEKITSIYSYMDNKWYNQTASPIKNIKGIELLTNLTSVDFRYHEIDDISEIAWENLTKLKYVDFRGNNLKLVPNFSVNTMLETLDLTENMLSAETIATIKVPKGCNVLTDNQKLTTDDKCGDHLTWKIEDGTLTISGTGDMYGYGLRDDYDYGCVTSAPWGRYVNELEKIVIQEGVTSIGNYAFYGCSNFTGDLIIPDSVTSIGYYAFKDCTGFDGKLILGNNITEIKQNTFENCSGFTGVLIIPDSVASIGVSAFANCTGFDGNLILGENIIKIEDSAFANCVGFVGGLTIPNSVVSIGGSSFYNCKGFNGKLTLGNNVAEIGSNAFDGCSGFVGGLTIPDSVSIIELQAFHDCSGFTGSLTIPDSVTKLSYGAFWNCTGFDGYLILGNSITTIGKNAFLNCKGFIGKLIIPDSVTEIGDSAFSNCSGFTGDLIIPSNVSKIGYGAFSNCAGLNGTLTLGKNVAEIGDSAFYKCSGFIGGLTIPENVTEIGDSAFYKCSGFTGDLIIPNKVVSIGNYAFGGCSGLNGILTIGNNVKTIGKGAFSNLSGLVGNLIIPNSVIEIGNSAFYNCSGFTGDLIIPDSVNNIGYEAFKDCSGFDGNLSISNSLTSIEYGVFSGCSGFTGNLMIPDNVTNIGRGAFGGCSGFTGNLIISDNVTAIGEAAFNGCSGFDGKLIIGNGLTEIEANTFYYCSGFTGGLIIPNGITKIGGWAFFECKGFTDDLTIGDSVTQIGTNSFYECGFSGNLIIGNNVTEIGYGAFAGCSNFIGNLVIPDSVVTIGNNAFARCSGFDGDLIIGNGVIQITTTAFSGCNGFKGKLVIGNSVTKIEDNAFANCNGFKGTLTIGESVTSIGNSAFWKCSVFSGNLFIPNNVTSIGNGAFLGCSGFDGVLSIPDSVTSIGSSAFSECIGFTGNLSIPKQVTSIDENTFSGCSGFDGNLTLPDGLTSIGNDAFSGCAGFKGSLTIPSGVTRIGNNAFLGCSGFDGNLSIPDSVTSIGSSAFSSCSGFVGNLSIPNLVTSIEDKTFSDCSGFDGNLTLPDGLTSIGNDAFSGCAKFKGSLIIPNSVTSIGNSAFSRCGFNGKLSLSDNLMSIGEGAFLNCGGFTGNLAIPTSLTSIVNDSFSGCSGFSGNLTIPNSVTEIGNNAFKNCSGFKGELTIPSSVTSVGESAFENCSGFTGDLVIPNNLTKIFSKTFKNCNGFTGSLIISNSVTEIGSDAFNGCSGFTGNLMLHENFKSIGSHAFDNCNSIDNVIFEGIAPSIGSSAFSKVETTIYYPSWTTGWTSIVGNSYGGALKWVSYDEGTEPWNMTFVEGSPLISVIMNGAPSSLTYDDIEYNPSSFDATFIVYYMEFDYPTTYENVKVSIELPDGLSFEENSVKNTLTYKIGTMDSSDANKKVVLEPIKIYTDGDYATDKFLIKVSATADGYDYAANTLLSIPVKSNPAIVGLSPAVGETIDLAGLRCKVTFNQAIEIKENSHAYLCSYDNPDIKSESDQFYISTDGGNVLYISFNDNYKSTSVLEPNTKYYIEIGDDLVKLANGEYVSISDKDYWTFSTCKEEHSLVKNLDASAKIPYNLYLKLYKPLTANWVRLLDDGTNGICFGFSYALGAWNEGYKGIIQIADNLSYLSLKDFKLETKGKLPYTFHEYMQLAQLYQQCSYVQTEQNANKNKYEKLYKAIKNYQDNVGPPIILNVHKYQVSGHSIVPLKIISEDDYSVIVLVYNCNGNGNLGQNTGSRFFDKFIMKKENGKFVDWEFKDYNDDGNIKNYFNFIEVDTTLDNYILTDSNYCFEISNLIYSKSEISGRASIDTVGENDYNSTDENKYYLYWTDDNIVTRESTDATDLSELGITDGYKEVSVNAPLNAYVTLNLDDNTAKLNLSETTSYSIKYKNVLEDDSIRTITIDGQADSDVVSKQTSDGIILTSDDMTDVVVSIDDGTNSKEVKFSSDDNSVLITETNNNIVVYEDSNDNGTYDKIVGDNDKNQGNGDTSNKDDLKDETEDKNIPSTGEGSEDDGKINTGNQDDKDIPSNGEDSDNKDESDDGDEKSKDKDKTNGDSNSGGESKISGATISGSVSSNRENIENVLVTSLENGYTINQVNLSAKHILQASLLNKYYGQKMYIAAIMQADFGLMIDMMQVPVMDKDIDVQYSIISSIELSPNFNTILLKANKPCQLEFDAIFNFNIGEAYIGKKAYVYMLNNNSTGYDLIGSVNVNSIGNVAFTSDKITDYIILVEK